VKMDYAVIPVGLLENLLAREHLLARDGSRGGSYDN